MARKSMDMPTGVEVFRNSIRIRFTWNGRRCSETLPYPVTPKGIAAASILRDQVVRLSKMDLLDDAKYSELFPGSAVPEGLLQQFGGSEAVADPTRHSLGRPVRSTVWSNLPTTSRFPNNGTRTS